MFVRNRHSIRLPNYDYTAPGTYFVTICAWHRHELFGHVTNGVMYLNEYGYVAHSEWLRSVEIRCEIEIDTFIIMPNHMHGIVVIKNNNVGAHGRAPLQGLNRQPRSLGSFIAGFKSIATKQINELRQLPKAPVWQRNYYEHVIRNESELNRMRKYISDNPQQWINDELYPGL